MKILRNSQEKSIDKIIKNQLKKSYKITFPLEFFREELEESGIKKRQLTIITSLKIKS
jgi:hypothetical protein